MYQLTFETAKADTPVYPIEDWWDGRIFRHYMRHQGLLHDDRRATALKMGMDGVSVLEHPEDHHTATPILLENLNLPPHKRSRRSNQMLIGILLGKKEPTALAGLPRLPFPLQLAGPTLSRLQYTHLDQLFLRL